VTDVSIEAGHGSAAKSDAEFVTRDAFGVTPDGLTVERITLRNAHGAELSFLSLGGIVQSLRMPDRHGTPGEVVLGFNSLAPYLADTRYMGAIVGRYANRIASGRFALDGHTIALETNEPPHHLHGGTQGLNTKHWAVSTFSGPGVVGAWLTCDSPDGEGGYPGALAVRVTYTLSDDNRFAVAYEATTTTATPVNLTHHCYFHLSDTDDGTVLDHTLQVYASRFLPVDATMIPTGTLDPVAGTPFDFTTPHRIGARIADEDEQLAFGGGYDHSYVVAHNGAAVALAARLQDDTTGRVLEVYTTEPAIQVCTGNSFDGSQVGRDGHQLQRYAGIALETQHFPDSPNRSDFPSTILRPDGAYRSRTEYRFSVKA
jgi:aldose 1-epimerase